MPDRQEAAMLCAVSYLYFFNFLRMGESVVPVGEYDPQIQLNFSDAHVNNRSFPE